MIHRHSCGWYTRLALAILLLLALLVPALSALPASGAAGERWSCEARPWLLGNRVNEWHGDTGGAASAFPDGVLAVVASDTVARKFRLWAYTEAGGDLLLEVPWANLQYEPGTVFPTGRFDPTGPPTVIYHGGQIKFVIRLWNGGGNGPAPLARVYTWCGLSP